MSTVAPTELACPACDAVTFAVVADSVSADRAPWMRDSILDGTFHNASCHACGARFFVEKELLYTDFGRGHFIGVFPPEDRARFAECGELVARTFREALYERAPKAVAAWGDRMLVRVVFGLGELREKLLAWELGLDDGALELLKLDICADRPALFAAGIVGLRLDAALQSGTLGFVTLRASGAPGEPGDFPMSVPRALYDAVLAALPSLREAHAALLGGPYVNLLRYLLPSPPPAGTPRASDDRRIWRDSRP